MALSLPLRALPCPLLLGAALLLHAASADQQGNVGDVDCSTTVGPVDAQLVLQLEAALIPSAACEKNADVDENGTVTAADAAFILQRVAGLIPVLPPPSVVLASVPTSCPEQARLTDGALMATEILARQTDALLLHRGARITLAIELDGVLSRVRAAHAEVEHIDPRTRYELGQVFVLSNFALGFAIQELLAGGPETVAFVTGFDGFDALNTRLRLTGFDELPLGAPAPITGLILCFPQHLNPEPAAAAFGALEEVTSASATEQAGDGPDIDALREGQTWYVVFRDASGDCPAGCTVEEFFYFTVADETVSLIEEAEALRDARFVELRCLTGAHDCT